MDTFQVLFFSTIPKNNGLHLFKIRMDAISLTGYAVVIKKSQDDPNCNDFTTITVDKQQYFEKVVDGKWAPYSLAMMDKKATAGGPPHYKGIQFYRRIDAQLATEKKTPNKCINSHYER